MEERGGVVRGGEEGREQYVQFCEMTLVLCIEGDCEISDNKTIVLEHKFSAFGCFAFIHLMILLCVYLRH